MKPSDILPASFTRHISVEDRGHDTECWIWTGKHDRYRYPLWWQTTRRRWKLAHRHSAEVAEIATDIETVDHLCHQRSCVNPEHLEAVSRRENSIRANAYRWHGAKPTKGQRAPSKEDDAPT